jgi:hypothetical protein
MLIIAELRRTKTKSPAADMKLPIMILAVIFLVSTATAEINLDEGNDFKYYNII